MNYFRNIPWLNKQKNFIKPKITNLLSNKDLSMPDKIKLSKEQILSINKSLKQSFSIITGGPGSGKSTLIVGLVESLRKIGKKIVICAPTGRAAKRLTEYKELRSLEPTTIHMHLTVIKNKLNISKWTKENFIFRLGKLAKCWMPKASL